MVLPFEMLLMVVWLVFIFVLFVVVVGAAIVLVLLVAVEILRFCTVNVYVATLIFL